jgi:hypothetical protein
MTNVGTYRILYKMKSSIIPQIRTFHTQLNRELLELADGLAVEGAIVPKHGSF